MLIESIIKRNPHSEHVIDGKTYRFAPTDEHPDNHICVVEVAAHIKAFMAAEAFEVFTGDENAVAIDPPQDLAPVATDTPPVVDPKAPVSTGDDGQAVASEPIPTPTTHDTVPASPATETGDNPRDKFNTDLSELTLQELRAVHEAELNTKPHHLAKEATLIAVIQQGRDEKSNA